jgi:hypothetical protein
VDERQSEALNRAGFEARVALFETIRARAEGATSAQLVNLAEAWAWLTSPAQPHGSSAAPKGGA